MLKIVKNQKACLDKILGKCQCPKHKLCVKSIVALYHILMTFLYALNTCQRSNYNYKPNCLFASLLFPIMLSFDKELSLN